MQNPKITEIENKFEKRIKRVVGFENLVNVVVLSLDQIEKELEKDTNSMYQIYESKTASTVRFVLYNPCMKSEIFSTGDIPIQVPDAPKK
jgi:hypothetical protein